MSRPDHARQVELVQAITTQFNLMRGQVPKVKAACAELRQQLLADTDWDRIYPLAALLTKRSGSLAAVLFDFIRQIVPEAPQPWRFMQPALTARDKILAEQALDILLELVRTGSLQPDQTMLEDMADKSGHEGHILNENHNLAKIQPILSAFLNNNLTPPAVNRQLYLSAKSAKIRYLAARLLDLGDEPLDPDLGASLFGRSAYSRLAPYLAFTRATHQEALGLIETSDQFQTFFKAFCWAETELGQSTLKEIIGRLGWSRINAGIEVESLTGLSVKGSLPVMVTDTEAKLLACCRDVHRTPAQTVVYAFGGQISADPVENKDDDPVARFRGYNLVHAEQLVTMLDVAPLSVEKIWTILERMDRIVADYVHLFAAYSEECAILPEVYQSIKDKVLALLQKEADNPQLSTDLTHLVLAFEDPRSAGEVQTLHGLKRYLHQKGLKLGFKLVETGRAPNRTIDLVLIAEGRILEVVSKIRYADFESTHDDRTPPEKRPYAVDILAQAFSRQLRYGLTKFPNADIFCYGNEVHYYLAFRNHPVFIRIDLAPPLRGGMIDLEYFGVSNYELNTHPNLSLDFIRHFFQQMDFDFELENTRIHARYDKERALTLADLCEKAEALLRLAPYLMDIDWIIGSLDLDFAAKMKVAAAWAGSFMRWGAIPWRQVLTQNRQGILCGLSVDSRGAHEQSWDGQGSYRDRFHEPPPEELFKHLNSALEALKLESLQILPEDWHYPLGQVRLEQILLKPLRQALARGQIQETESGFGAVPDSQFQLQNEVHLLAEMIDERQPSLLSALQSAWLMQALERSLTFETSGMINGYSVQQSTLSLRGELLRLYGLRDRKEMIRLVLYSRNDPLYRRRDNANAAWENNWETDAARLAALLRRHSYIDTGHDPIDLTPDDVARFITEVKHHRAALRPAPLAGERVIQGLPAAPGRAVGRVLFGTENRHPVDISGAILVAESIRPEDNTYLYHAAGVISTGGGILSHAGLLAVQFQKPAIIIPGRWQKEAGGRRSLLYQTLEFKIEKTTRRDLEICIRHDLRHREYALSEGDLVIIDTHDGTVQVLGQQRDTLTLYEGLQLYGQAARQLADAEDDQLILNLRGRRLRAKHQIEKVLRRLTDPILARFALYELLLGTMLPPDGLGQYERTDLIRLIEQQPAITQDARQFLTSIHQELERIYQDALEQALSGIPQAQNLHETLSLRLEVLRARQVLTSAAASLRACGLPIQASHDTQSAPDHGRVGHDLETLEQLVRHRIKTHRDSLAKELSALRASHNDPPALHLFRQLDHLDQIGLQWEPIPELSAWRSQINRDHQQNAEKLAGEIIVHSHQCCYQHHHLIGRKAANLAEIQRIAGPELVPPWFVVTNHALEQALASPIRYPLPQTMARAATLGQAIDLVLQTPGIPPAETIRSLWENFILPDTIRQPIVEAYTSMDEDQPPYLAIRSSAEEEDTEQASRAGEFDTFLYIRGHDQLVRHLKLIWASLWNERAIHNRRLINQHSDAIRAGVIVQRIIPARVSGVIQTINLARRKHNQIVINVGLGLGEGIVSGRVGADLITVQKQPHSNNQPYAFNYRIGDKNTCIQLNQRTGSGTIISPTPYHQRFRPALEYAELHELLRATETLEKTYGYPLDIEFAFHHRRLYLLQVRPLPYHNQLLRHTASVYPLHPTPPPMAPGAS